MFNYNTAIFNSVELHGIFSPEETVQRNYQNLQSFIERMGCKLDM